MAEEVTNTISWKFNGDPTDLNASIEAVEAHFVQLGIKADRVTAKTKKVGTSTKEVASNFDRAKAAGRAYGGRLGELGEKLDNVKVAMGGAASGTVLATAAIVVGVAAAAAYVVVVNKLVSSAAEAAGELAQMGLVTEGQVDALDSAAASAGKLGTQFKALGVVLVSGLAPRIEKINIAIFGITDAIGQFRRTGTVSIDAMAERWQRLNVLIEDTAVSVGDLSGIFLELETSQIKTDARRAVAIATRDKAGQTREAQLRTDIELSKTLAGLASDDAQARLRLSTDLNDTAALTAEVNTIRMEGLADIAVAERALADELDARAKERIKTAEAETEARLKLAQSNQDTILGGMLETNEARRLLSDEDKERQHDSIKANNEDAARSAADQMALDKAVQASKVALAGQLLALTKQLAGDNIAAQKGVALGEVALATAVGLASAFKDVNPITTPIKVAAVLANSATQVAAILATNEHGGPGGSSASTAGFQGAQGGGGGGGAPGAPGDSGGGGTFIVLGNEVFDAQTQRALRRDSALDRAIRRRGNSQSRLGNAGDA